MEKSSIFLLLAVMASCLYVQDSSASISSWSCIAGVSYISQRNPFAMCSLAKMGWYYAKMRYANCKNCDRYFHCMGNYKAVYSCGNTYINRKIAQIISNCREWGDNSADSRADQEANRYGRNGGNCARRYLCNVNCAYSPNNGSCRKSNC